MTSVPLAARKRRARGGKVLKPRVAPKKHNDARTSAATAEMGKLGLSDDDDSAASSRGPRLRRGSYSSSSSSSYSSSSRRRGSSSSYSSSGSEGSSSSSEDDEGGDGYKPGGYHPVRIGDTYHNGRYLVVKKLGWGHFSTVWLARDLTVAAAKAKEGDGEGKGVSSILAGGGRVEYVALKVQKSAQHYREAAYDEVELLSAAKKQAAATAEGQRQGGHVVRLLEHFEHRGVNGRHVCMVFELLGCNLLSIIKQTDYRGLPLGLVKSIARQVCEGLDFLHRRCQIIHTDLKPENILIDLPLPLDATVLAVRPGFDPTAVAGGGAAVMPGGGGKGKGEQQAAATAAKPSTEAVDMSKLTPEERKRLKQKLRKKKQKAKKKGQQQPQTKQQEEEEEEEEEDGDDEEKKEEGGPLNGAEKGKGAPLVDEETPNPPLPPLVPPLTSEEGWVALLRCEEEPCQSNLLLPSSSSSSSSSSTSRDVLAPVFATAKVEVLEADDWSYPASEVAGRVMLATSADRLQEALGRGEEGNVVEEGGGEERLMQEWTVRLRLTPEVVGGEEDSMLEVVTFMVRGHGKQVDLPGLRAAFLRQTPPTTTNTQPPFPTLWSVRYHTAHVGVVLGFLEYAIPGLKFLAISSPSTRAALQDLTSGFCHGLQARTTTTASNGKEGNSTTTSTPKALVGLDMAAVLAGVALPGDETPRLLADCIPYQPLEHRVSFLSHPPVPNGTTTQPSSSSSLPTLLDLEEVAQCRVVVVDLGNACWTTKHFSEDIQTRQYRAPEVLVGAKYDTSADMWSLACLLFELLTGDMLFNPRAGENYDRDEDHLALMIELLGKYPKKLATGGKHSKDFFNRKGELKHIHSLKYWGLEEVLEEKYKFSKAEARGAADFLLPLLDFNPQRRATAQECLTHAWLYEEVAAAGVGGASSEASKSEN